MIGGVDAVPGQMPGMLGLTAPGKANFGGAVLLSVDAAGRGVALTAAHCLKYDLNTVRVHGGSLQWNSGGYEARVTEYFVHPDYALRAGIDLAVLILAEVPVHAATAPPLADLVDHALYAEGNHVTFFGWGPLEINKPNPTNLQTGSLPLVAPGSCNKEDRDSNADFACCKPVANVQTSPGDSGGPVISGVGDSLRLVGVVEGGQFGESIATRVDRQRTWILNRPNVRSYVVRSRPVAIAVAPNGHKYVAHASEAYVTGAGDAPGAVSVFDGNWALQRSIAVGNPSAVIVSPGGEWLFVADRATKTVSKTDLATGQVVGVGEFDKGDLPPSALAFAAHNSRLFALNGSAVTILNAGDLQSVKTLEFDNTLTGIALAPDGAHLYVTNGYDNEVKVIDTTTNTVTGTWDVGGYDNSCVVAAADRIYVGSASREIYVLDSGGQKKAEITISADCAVKSLAVAGTELFVGYETTNSSNLPQVGVQVFSTLPGNAPARTLQLGGAPLISMISTQAGEVLAVNRDVSSISVIHP